jgi:hypothetical protein
MSLDISPEVENLLEQEARRAGVSVDTLLTRTFAPQTEPPSVNSAKQIRDLLTAWQKADNTPIALPAPNDGSMTPSEALFQQWRQEAIHMTDDEKQAEEHLWQQFQENINTERDACGMRRIY